MIPTQFWFLSLGAATLVVAVYDLLFGFTLRRRQRALEPLGRDVEQTALALRRIVDELTEEQRRCTEELRALRERIAQLQPRSDALLYEQAISLAEQGAESQRLASCFGLTRGEAELVRLLHGSRASRAS